MLQNVPLFSLKHAPHLRPGCLEIAGFDWHRLAHAQHKEYVYGIGHGGLWQSDLMYANRRPCPDT